MYRTMSEREWLSFLDDEKSGFVLVSSSHGYILASGAGKVLMMDRGWKGQPPESVPVKFDMVEWRANSQFADETGKSPIDILDLGFRTAAGDYEPPDEGWRELMREESRPSPRMACM